MRFSHLSLFGLIALFLILGELALELRANHRGFDTLVLGDPSPPRAGGDRGAAELGPTADFPFRSPVVPVEKPPGAIRIWFASSSYAQDTRFPVPIVFPNAAARQMAEITGRSVQMLNRSRAGFSIRSNIEHLEQDGARWAPDVVVLYQLTNDLHLLARPGAESARELEADPGSLSWDLEESLGRLYEQTTLFAQLSANVTPYLTEQRLLPDSMPGGAAAAFRQRLNGFVDAARSLEATPVLMTFAPRVQDPDSLTADLRSWMLRWNPHLSPEGYLATVLDWNELIRQTAAERDAPLIDMERHMRGRSGLYRDLAHFTPAGHQEFARILADELVGVLEDRR